MEDIRLRWPSWVGLVVDDLEGERAFYRDVLGLPESGSGEDWVWFDMGGGRLFELLARDLTQPQYADTGFTIAFEVDDIHSAASELERRGVRRLTDVQGGPESTQYWCYFRDREGHRFEIVQKA